MDTRKLKKILFSKIFNWKIFVSFPILLRVVSFFLPFRYSIKTKEVFSDGSKLVIARNKRLFYYVNGLNFRFEEIIKDYLCDRISLNESSVVIDIGSNIGEFSIAINKYFGVKQIIAFEPDPTEYIALTKNFLPIIKNDPIKVALSNESKDYVSFYLNNDTGDSSLVNSSGECIKIPVDTLDNQIKDLTHITLIKLEAEGFEPEILHGGLKTLKRTKYIVVDCGPERNGEKTIREVTKILVQLGFELVDINNSRFTLLFENSLI